MLSKLPPVPSPSVPPAPALPPIKRGLPLPLLLIGGIILVMIVLLLAALILRPSRPRPQPVAPSPTPSQDQPVSETSPSPAPPPEITRLPLTDLAGHSLLAVTGGQVWLFEFTPQGPRKSLILEKDAKIADLAVSPNGKLLAITFAAPGADLAASKYPPAGLSVISLADKIETEFISLQDLPARYPIWSADSLYLGVWNDGRSSILFDMTTKRTLITLTAPAGGQIGPLVFVPRKPRMSYVENGTLYESDYSGTRAKVTDGVIAMRTVQNAPQLPNPHQYSTSTRYIAFHDSLGQLVIYDTTDASRQILAEWAKDQDVADKFSYGAPVFFDNRNNLIYYDLRKSTYTPGIDDNPLFIYTPSQKTSRPFFANPKTPTVLVSLIASPTSDAVLVEDAGFRVFSASSAMQANCDYTGFKYRYYSRGGGLDYTSPLKVWSQDSQYLFSLDTNQVAKVSSCAISAPFDSQTFDLASWIK